MINIAQSQETFAQRSTKKNSLLSWNILVMMIKIAQSQETFAQLVMKLVISAHTVLFIKFNKNFLWL
jgi:hypothetical protein